MAKQQKPQPRAESHADSQGTVQECGKLPATIRGLTEHDWNFEAVQTLPELQTCLLYEMARESVLIREQVRLWHTGPPQDEEQAKWWRDAYQSRPTPSFAYREADWSTLIVHWGTLGESPAWLALNAKGRNYLVTTFFGRPAVHSGFDPDVGLIRQALKEKWADTEANARVVSDDGRNKRMEISAWPEASAIGSDGRERVVMVIDWAGFDEPAIRDAFEQWLKGRRPVGVEPRSKTRRGNDSKHTGHLRDWLNALGAARLNAKFTPRQLFDRWPDAWRLLGGNQDFHGSEKRVQQRLRDGRGTLAKKFGEFFNGHGEPACLAEFAKRPKR